MLRIVIEQDGETKQQFNIDQNDWSTDCTTAAFSNTIYTGEEHAHYIDGNRPYSYIKSYITNPDTRNFAYGGVCSSSTTVCVCVDTAGETAFVYHSGVVSLTTLGTTESNLSTYMFVQNALKNRSVFVVLDGVDE